MSASPSRSARRDVRLRPALRQRRARLAKSGGVPPPLSGQREPTTALLARGAARQHGPSEGQQEHSRSAFPCRRFLSPEGSAADRPQAQHGGPTCDGAGPHAPVLPTPPTSDAGRSVACWPISSRSQLQLPTCCGWPNAKTRTMTGTVPEGREPSPVDRAALGANDLNVHRALAKSILPGARVGRCWRVRHEAIPAFQAVALVTPAERAAKTRLRAEHAALTTLSSKR
jgi:hypothetical protein